MFSLRYEQGGIGGVTILNASWRLSRPERRRASGGQDNSSQSFPFVAADSGIPQYAEQQAAGEVSLMRIGQAYFLAATSHEPMFAT